VSQPEPIRFIGSLLARSDIEPEGCKDDDVRLYEQADTLEKSAAPLVLLVEGRTTP
jgi:hypothetical protein